jgi:asparagine synthase (glutamine-hydrolysing)
MAVGFRGSAFAWSQVVRWSELARLAADRDAPVRPLLDTEVLKQATAVGGREDVRPSAELVLGLDGWLRRYDITLEV